MDESWLAVIYCFIIKAVASGIRRTASLIGVYLIEQRGFTREALSWVTTIFSTIVTLGCTFSAGFCRLYGTRVSVCLGAVILSGANVASALSSQDKVSIYLTHASSAAMGVALFWTASSIIANTYYCKRRQQVNGMVMFAARAITVVFLPLTSWTLGQYGLQGAFFMWAGISLNCVVVGMLIPALISDDSPQQDNAGQKKGYEATKKYSTQGNLQTLERECSEDTIDKAWDLKSQGSDKRNEEHKTLSPQSSKTGNSKSMENKCLQECFFHLCHTFIAFDLFKNWRFTLSIFSCQMLIYIPVNYAIHGHLADFIVQAGHPMDLTWQPLVIVVVGNAFGSFLIGARERSISLVSKVFCLAVLIMSVGFLVVPFVAEHYWLICIWTGTFGLAEGLFNALKGPILAEIVPIEDFDRAYGTGYIGDALFYVLVCPLFGILFDRTGTYKWTFLICGGLLLTSCFTNALILFYKF